MTLSIYFATNGMFVLAFGSQLLISGYLLCHLMLDKRHTHTIHNSAVYTCEGFFACRPMFVRTIAVKIFDC